MFNIVGIIVSLMLAENSIAFGYEGSQWSPIAAAAAPIIVLLVSRILSGPVLERLHFSEIMVRTQDLDDPTVREALLRESAGILKIIPRLKLSLQVMAMLVFGGVCYLGWPSYVIDSLGVPRNLHYLPMVFPYLLAQMGTWPATIALDRRSGDARWTLKKYAKFAWRMNLMTLAPMLILGTSTWAMLEFIPGLAELETAFKDLEQFAIMLLLIPMSMLLPAFVRYLIPARRLQNGMLRSTLESYAKENGIRIRQIFVWKTGTSHFATAFVIGLIPQLRYVFITDALLKKANSEQILAVFAHECGHVKHRHLWYLLSFLLFFALAMTALQFVLFHMSAPKNVGFALIFASVIGMYHLFGYLSRRFERQADAFAAKTVGLEPLVSMFLKLGQGNPSAMVKDGWRHFSIGRRIRELEISNRTPEVVKFFGRELRRVKLFIVVLAIGSAALLVEPTRESVYMGLSDWSLTKYDNARTGRVEPEQLEVLRQNTIQRARDLQELSENLDTKRLIASRRNECVALALGGEGTDDLDDLIAEVEEAYEKEDVEKKRKNWREEIKKLKATKRSVNRAVALGTSFETELAKELD